MTPDRLPLPDHSLERTAAPPGGRVEAIKWINRHGASWFALALLLGLAALAHMMARFKMGLSDHFALVDMRTVRELRLIGYVHTHPWVPVSYAVMFFVSLLWLEVRGASRWNVWLSFGLLAVPCLAYMWVCEHISNKLLSL